MMKEIVEKVLRARVEKEVREAAARRAGNADAKKGLAHGIPGLRRCP